MNDYLYFKFEMNDYLKTMDLEFLKVEDIFGRVDLLFQMGAQDALISSIYDVIFAYFFFFWKIIWVACENFWIVFFFVFSLHKSTVWWWATYNVKP